MAAKLKYGSLDLQGIRAAHGKFNKTLHKQMILLMKGGIREFAKVAAENINVETGMAAASLQPLAQEVGGGVLGIIRPRVKLQSGKKGQTSLAGRYYHQRRRDISEGISAGENAFTINFGTVKRPRMFFRFDIKVYQWARWETSSPHYFDALRQGLAAMIKYINANFEKRFPTAELRAALNPYPRTKGLK
jgi:hypothetical protein